MNRRQSHAISMITFDTLHCIHNFHKTNIVCIYSSEAQFHQSTSVHLLVMIENLIKHQAEVSLHTYREGINVIYIHLLSTASITHGIIGGS